MLAPATITMLIGLKLKVLILKFNLIPEQKSIQPKLPLYKNRKLLRRRKKMLTIKLIRSWKNCKSNKNSLKKRKKNLKKNKPLSYWSRRKHNKIRLKSSKNSENNRHSKKNSRKNKNQKKKKSRNNKKNHSQNQNNPLKRQYQETVLVYLN